MECKSNLHPLPCNEPSIPFHTLVKLVAGLAEIINEEKVPTFNLPPEFFNVTSKLASQKLSSESYDPNLLFVCTQTNDRNSEMKTQF